MADEDLLGTMAEVDGEGGEGAEGGGGSPLMKYLPLIVGVLAVQIVIAYFVATWWFAPPKSPPAETTAKQEASALPAAGAESGPQKPVEPAVIYDKLPTIVVNPAGTKGLRFLSVQIHLGLSDPKVGDMIEKKKLASRIQDCLIDVLRSKTLTQLDPANHNKLKAEIMEKLNAFLGRNAVVAIYFQGFVLQ